jgi:hypothetical protein
MWHAACAHAPNYTDTATRFPNNDPRAMCCAAVLLCCCAAVLHGIYA